MTIQEIYQAFDKIGCLTFTTIDENNAPESRVAHLRGYDDDGIYFMTMHTKNFYKHLKSNPNIALCGIYGDSSVAHDEEGMPSFQIGYTIRLSGTAREIPMDIIKAKNNPIFDLCIKDQEKYPAMVVFCIQSGRGDIFDHDFECKTRENKLHRSYFAYNGAKIKEKGLTIRAYACTACGVCKEKCSFLAISEKNGKYWIDPQRCDECGDCKTHCHAGAIQIQSTH